MIAEVREKCLADVVVDVESLVSVEGSAVRSLGKEENMESILGRRDG